MQNTTPQPKATVDGPQSVDTELSFEEMEADLNATIQDRILCEEIAARIQRFITESDEDRSFLKIQVIRWCAMSDKATTIENRIRLRIKEAGYTLTPAEPEATIPAHTVKEVSE